jgi:AcrR family transcriptional regulator
VNRARSAEAKLARREQILGAATDLLDHEPYEHVTMASVAAAAGVAKGTPYLYWTTKEELFLEAAQQAYAALFHALAEQILAAPEATPGAVAGQMMAALEQQPQVLRLLPLLHAVLERNASLESVLAFKRAMLRGMVVVAAALEKRLPWMGPTASVRLLLRIHVALVALRQVAEPGGLVGEAMKAPDLAPFDVDFEVELRELVLDLLIAAEARGRGDG